MPTTNVQVGSRVCNEAEGSVVCVKEAEITISGRTVHCFASHHQSNIAEDTYFEPSHFSPWIRCLTLALGPALNIFLSSILSLYSQIRRHLHKPSPLALLFPWFPFLLPLFQAVQVLNAYIEASLLCPSPPCKVLSLATPVPALENLKDMPPESILMH
jgi:hypothetical protein